MFFERISNCPKIRSASVRTNLPMSSRMALLKSPSNLNGSSRNCRQSARCEFHALLKSSNARISLFKLIDKSPAWPASLRQAIEPPTPSRSGLAHPSQFPRRVRCPRNIQDTKGRRSTAYQFERYDPPPRRMLDRMGHHPSPVVAGTRDFGKPPSRISVLPCKAFGLRHRPADLTSFRWC